MRRQAYLLLCIVGLSLLLSGCRTATQVREVPRMDLVVEGKGNRGYLVGTPPPAKVWKTTRQMVETDIEIPSFYKPRPGSTAPAQFDSPAEEPEADTNRIQVGGRQPEGPTADDLVAMPTTDSYDSYTVKKGDSLWTIAAKPEVYGTATQWQRIFEANRDVLGNPADLKEGMMLKIPRDGAQENATTHGDEGITYTK